MFGSAFLYLLSLVLCMADVLAVGFFEHKILLSLLCLYTTTLFHHHKQFFLIFISLLLATQALMLGASFNQQLFIIIPLSIVALKIQSLLRDTQWLPYLFLVIALVIPHLLNPNLPFTSIRGILFIFAQICVNLIVLLLFEKTLSQR